MIKYATRVRKPYPTLYHITFDANLEGVWVPKPPDGDYTLPSDPTLYAEPTDARISLSPSVEQCFQAVYANVKHLFEVNDYPYLLFYVYTPRFTGRERIVTPHTLTSERLVHDAHITEEHCVLDPLRMVRSHRIKVSRPSKTQRLEYYAFNIKTKEPYGWLPYPVTVETVSLEHTTPSKIREELGLESLPPSVNW